MSVVLEAIGAAVPERVVTNDDLAAVLDTSDEWVRSRTGIAQRRVADAGTATSDLAVDAGARALKAAGAAEVGAVVVATTTPDQVCPATAPAVAARLGLGTVAAFDVNGACAGFVYALAVGAGLIETGVTGRALVIGADTLSRIVNPADRDTAILFGDGAGAVLLRSGGPDEPGALGPFDLGSDGDRAGLLEVPAGGSRLPADAATVGAGAHFLHMDGREVYRQAVVGMVASSRALLEREQLAAGDVDWLVGHQANARILEAVASRLGIPPERCPMNIDRYGNTSAASIPLVLSELPAHAGDRVLLTAFGAGLSWGSALLTWPDLD